ncbi:hypothetical protein, partial [Bifidobacterium longum]|uniref:hypothetical protein n=1 Tax=Bifidobacterium longum TaxID=216816 RepID=UPI002025B474
LREIQIDRPPAILVTEHNGLQSGHSRVQHFVRIPGGYTNDFLDPVATEPVVDQASAVRVYTARLTYTF